MIIKAVVDRIEGDKAILRFKHFKGELILPLKALPEDSVQGTVIEMMLRKDTKESAKLKKEISKILEELDEAGS